MSNISAAPGSAPPAPYELLPGTKYIPHVEPLSTNLPDQLDYKNTETIVDLLKKHNRFPSHEESVHREEVLGKLDSLIKQWIKQVSLKVGLSELAEDAGSKLVTFGSYRLGVHGPGADIDTLCIAPRHVTRQHFFEDLREMLLNSKEVTELTCVPDAHVPVITMEFAGVQIDLLFAQLAYNMIPEDLDILNEYNLKNVDEGTQRSLNGPRVADEILRLVPNEENFKMTLRAIKLWAKNRGTYGNVVGYLGGIAWALLTAKICQLYPNALPSKLLAKFFNLYSMWNWPAPIMLKPVEEGTLGHKVWNPKIHAHDKRHIMPVITPAYPSMNSTFNVSRTTLRVMTEEFIRGNEIVVNAERGKESWDTLFEETDFFVRYKNYLQIEVAGENVDDFRAWEGYVQSKLRFLIQGLEQVPNVLLHPYPFPFTNGNSQYQHNTVFYIGLKHVKQQTNEGPKEVNLTVHVNQFVAYLEKWERKKPTMIKPAITPIRQSEIPESVLSKEKKSELLKKTKLARRRKKQLEAENAKRMKTQNGTSVPSPVKSTSTISSPQVTDTKPQVSVPGLGPATSSPKPSPVKQPLSPPPPAPVVPLVTSSPTPVAATTPTTTTTTAAVAAPAPSNGEKKEEAKPKPKQEKIKLIKYEELEDEENEMLGILNPRFTAGAPQETVKATVKFNLQGPSEVAAADSNK